LVISNRLVPVNSLVPLLVVTLRTPPVKRPYFAEMPLVSTCTWSM